MDHSLFTEIGLVIIAATGFALLMRRLKQPPFLGYILAGIAIGPLGAGLMDSAEVFQGIRQIAITLLLFLVGLELDWQKARYQISAPALLSFLQIGVSAVVGFAFATLLGWDWVTGIYLGLALAFSSTVVAVKILSEDRDMNSLHGRLSVGILLFHDIAAIIFLAILAGLGTPTSLGMDQVVFLLAAKALLLLALLWVLSRHILPDLFRRIARSNELLFVSSLGWCFIVALLAAKVDFPIELGAFLAGISLAPLPYTHDILNRLRSLRDFFLIILFATLGSHLEIPHGPGIILTAGLIGLTVVGKPLFAFFLLRAKGYKNRPAFITSLAQGQISELSIILVEIGLVQMVITHEIASSIITAAIVSIFTSSILLNNREKLYSRFRSSLQRILPDNHAHTVPLKLRSINDHIVIFGYHRVGYHILKHLQDSKRDVLVVDFNPDIIQRLRSLGVHCMYGDLQDEDIVELTNLEKAHLVISTIPHQEETTHLIQRIGKFKRKPLLIVTSHHIDDALSYYQLGADYVMLPHVLGGEHVGSLIARYEKQRIDSLASQHKEEIKLLRERNNALYHD